MYVYIIRVRFAHVYCVWVWVCLGVACKYWCYIYISLKRQYLLHQASKLILEGVPEGHPRWDPGRINFIALGIVAIRKS